MPKPSRLTPLSSNAIVEQHLHLSLGQIETLMTADCLAFAGSMYYGIEDFVRDAVEQHDPKRGKLVVVLDTDGGLIEVAQRIADTLRYHYPACIDFVVPNYAMSAGTVLAMAGDAIHMDYYSILGPIDPQVYNRDGKLVPALGYLAKFDELIAKSKTKAGLSDAEMAYLASHFDPADLYSYRQAKNLSIQLLKQWLVKYKFKDWNETETRKKPVTLKMKERRASEIADKLNDTELWNSHSRPIGMQVLREVVKLKIDDFGTNPTLRDAIREYHRLLRDYMGRRGQKWAVHMVGHYAQIGGN